MKTKRLNILCFLLTAVLLFSVLSGCAEGSREANVVTSVSQLTTERVGVQAGTSYEESLLEICPDAEIAYYSYPTDMLVALDQGKLDYFLIEDISYQIEKDYFPWLACLDGSVASTPVGAAISQQSRYPLLQSQLEEFVENLKNSGQAEEMRTYWLSEFDSEQCVVDRSGITGENGIVAVAVKAVERI